MRIRKGLHTSMEWLCGDQSLNDEAGIESDRIRQQKLFASSIANTLRLAGRRPPRGSWPYRRPYMSGVTRTLTRKPSVACLSAARRSSRVLYARRVRQLSQPVQG